MLFQVCKRCQASETLPSLAALPGPHELSLSQQKKSCELTPRLVSALAESLMLPAHCAPQHHSLQGDSSAGRETHCSACGCGPARLWKHTSTTEQLPHLR